MRSQPPQDPLPGELEFHRRWLLEIARALLRDPNLAEDCVQDVFLAAVRDRPEDVGFSLRGWLRKVLVNRARKLGEREALRRFHEARASTEAGGARALDLLDLRELQAELERGLLALDERQRESLRLRYQEGLQPAAIAALLGVSIKTVDSWLYRAHGKLRQRLVGRFRDLGALLALRTRVEEAHADAPRTEAGATPAGTPADVPRRSPRWVAAAGVALVAGWLALWFAGQDPAGPRTARLSESGPGPERAPLPAGAEPVPEAHVRAATALESRRNVQVPSALFGGSPALWSGRVTDDEGAPVPGVRLFFEPMTEADWRLLDDRAHTGLEGYEDVRFAGEDPGAASTCVSGADGAFAFPVPRVQGWIDVDIDDEEWTLVSTTYAIELPPVADARVCIARGRQVAGRVLRPDGSPLAAARVRLFLPARLVGATTRFPTQGAYEPSVLTDATGAFEFPWIPDIADAGLCFEAEGHVGEQRRFDALGDDLDALTITLREDEPVPALTGYTLDVSGRPVAGAALSLDWATLATSDAEGRFRLPLREESAVRLTLRAAARGFQPVQCMVEPGEEPEIVFDSSALTLEGAVLRSDGTPHANAAVWLPAPTVLALPDTQAPVFAEHVMGGAQDGGSLEMAVTDAEGHFVLRGLADQDYIVRVGDQETREWFTSGPLHPGQDDVWLEFPADGCLAEVRGVVRGGDGAPLADVFVARSYPRLDVRLPDGRRYRTRSTGAKQRVGADGGFVLRGMGRQSAISVLGPALQVRYFDLADERDPSDLHLVAGRLCRVVVERGGFDFERFSFADATNGRFEFLLGSTGMLASLTVAPLDAETSAEYLVSDLARELVLWSGAREVARLPVALSAAGLNVLRP